MPVQVEGKGKVMWTLSDNCTGCRLCELACSFVKFHTFSPSKSLIRVERVGTDETFHAEFTDQCDVCGYCHAFCKFDAIFMKR